jgi:hypothetical protein
MDSYSHVLPDMQEEVWQQWRMQYSNNREELLDQILASADLFPVEEDGHRRLPEADSHVDFRDSLPSIENDPGRREGDVAPDHAPVTASFEL